ncbi:MAG: hypothetical protein H6560_02560 [Lewinellaceae bacterium]|nr:hypothetical protein [Lewinellaceae bacterium]
MKTLLSLVVAFGVIMAANSTLVAQNVWRGGTPGQEQEWNNPRNWSQNRVPDIDDIVLIPNTESRGGFYPVISKDAGPIYYLEVQGGATLSVTTNGKLMIDGVGKYEDAILLIGTIENKGEIRVQMEEKEAVAGHPENLMNTGSFIAMASPERK